MKDSPWIRNDNCVDMHIDCEFVDDVTGFHFISIGVILRSNTSSLSFYGIDTEFFARDCFLRQVHANDENTNWMWDNVYKHIHGNVKTHLRGVVSGTLPELREHLKDAVQFKTLKLSFDQTYPVVDVVKKSKLDADGGTEVVITDADPDIMIIGNQQCITQALVDATKRCSNTNDARVRLFCYYGAYDQYAMARLFGGMHNAPKNFDYLNYDFRSIGDAFGFNHDDYNPHTLHNACGDADAQYKTMRTMRDQIVQAFGQQLRLPSDAINQNW